MMYMIQLVQEGYWISDEKRAQLQRDLHFKVRLASVGLYKRKYSN